jgi:uncharacterized HAD superfamily protein
MVPWNQPPEKGLIWMTVNKTIYVDMDDVICETGRGFIELLHREFDRSVAFEDVEEFDLSVSFSMTSDEIEVFMARAHKPDFLSSLLPLPGALGTIQTWVDGGYQVDIMTGRPPSTRVVTEDWLQRHGVCFENLNFVDKYGRREIDSSFEDALTLADLAEKRFCLAVEDSLATAEFLVEHRVAPVALIDRPWNRKGGNGGIRKMTDWQELAEICSPPSFPLWNK